MRTSDGRPGAAAAAAAAVVCFGLVLLVQCATTMGDSVTLQTMSNTYHQFCIDRRQCSGHLLEFCDQLNLCECRPNSQFSEMAGACRPCPEVGVSVCPECCTGYGHECVGGVCINCYEYDNYYRCWPEDPTEAPQVPPSGTVIYITASQIALAAALIMGSVALITLLYRICSKPAISNSAAQAARGQSTDAHNTHLQSAFQRLSQRLSLTSMQARVMSRLRDQPPKYESQHNYDERMRQHQLEQDHQQQQQQPDGRDGLPTGLEPAVVDVDRSPCVGIGNRELLRATSLPLADNYGHVGQVMVVGVAPPCYDNDAYSLSDLPPPYTADRGGDQNPAVCRRTSCTIESPNQSHPKDVQTM